MPRCTFQLSDKDWPEPWKRPGGFNDMVDDSLAMSQNAFYNYVSVCSLRELAESLGYRWRRDQGDTLFDQPDVQFFRSTLHGRDVFYLTHSGVTYVFAK